MGMVREEKLLVKEGNYGKGAFAADDFKKGQIICALGGSTHQRDEMPKKDTKKTVRYVQIGRKFYLHISGNGDYLNHSCNPNAGLVIKGTNVKLKAIKNIKRGDEVTFDYSTTMNEDEYELSCHCGNTNCRKTIRDFKYLPITIRKKYVRMGIVPLYILEVIKNKH